MISTITDAHVWIRDGKLHRDDGPAVEYADGSGEWWRDGVLERARRVVGRDRTTTWFREGRPRLIAYRGGTREWYGPEGKLHRDDGPAIERANGTKEWYCGGKLHRESGPAIERADGSRLWYCEGKFHREDGPAIERANGVREWWYHGEPVFSERAAGDIRLVEFADGRRDWYRPGAPVNDTDFVKQAAAHFRKEADAEEARKLCVRFIGRYRPLSLIPEGRRREFLDALNERLPSL
jgi:hypothetical protein